MANYSNELTNSLATKCLEDAKAWWTAKEESPKSFSVYGKSKIMLSIFAMALAKYIAKSQPKKH